MSRSPDRDPVPFGQFAFKVATAGLVVVILGLAGIWYFLTYGGASAPSSPFRNLLTRHNNIPPDKAMLYYTRDGRQLVGTLTTIDQPGITATDKASLIVKRLIEGRDAASLRSPIPRGTQALSVFLTDNLAIVNLSKEFLTNLRGGADAEMLAVYSIVNSLLINLDSISAVQIKIQGEEVPTLHGYIDLDAPLIANTAITGSL